MDDEQHYERFGLDNDYEGGEWIGGEFFYRSKRQKRQQTSEDRLYGIFAGEDSDEEETRGRGGRRGGSSRTDFTKPVSFVSHGQVDPGMDDLDQETKVQAESQGDPEFKVGLGYQTFGPGGAEVEVGKSESDEGEDDVLPTVFGRRY